MATQKNEQKPGGSFLTGAPLANSSPSNATAKTGGGLFSLFNKKDPAKNEPGNNNDHSNIHQEAGNGTKEEIPQKSQQQGESTSPGVVAFEPLPQQSNPIVNLLVTFYVNLLSLSGCRFVMKNCLEENRALRCPEMKEVSLEDSMTMYHKNALPLYQRLRIIFYGGLSATDPESIMKVKAELSHDETIMEDLATQVEHVEKLNQMVKARVITFTTDAQINEFVGQFNGEKIFPNAFYKINGKNFVEHEWMRITHEQNVAIAKSDVEECFIAPSSNDNHEQASVVYERIMKFKSIMERLYVSNEVKRSFWKQGEPVIEAGIEFLGECARNKDRKIAKQCGQYHMHALDVMDYLSEMDLTDDFPSNQPGKTINSAVENDGVSAENESIEKGLDALKNKFNAPEKKNGQLVHAGS